MAEVTRRLLDYFTNDAIRPGDRLPPERRLAASMGVSRSAVREALAALELLGVVSVRPGSGTYLRGRASELLPQALSWGSVIGAPRTLEAIELRHGLEVQTARSAAEVIDTDALQELDVHLATTEADKASFADLVAADTNVHQVVGAAAADAMNTHMCSAGPG